jgi:hypothetical protein
MATSPQLPPKAPQRGPQEVLRFERVKKRSFPWPLLAIILAAAVLLELIVWLPRISKVLPEAAGAQAPAQTAGHQIQFSSFKMTAAPVGNAFYLDGLLVNNGNADLTAVQVQVDFLGQNEQMVGSQTRPVGEMSERVDLKSENLVDRPIKPGETRPVQIYVDHAPSNWNRQLPQLTVTEVTASKP